ncbi:hypothetical protein [Bradyrhizobium diazoefficiens]
MSLGDYFSAYFTAPVLASAMVCLYAGYQFGATSVGKKAQTLFVRKNEESERWRLDAEGRFIDTLRRELANIVVKQNPRRMIALYRKAWAFEREMHMAEQSRVQAELDALTERYRLYDDFDLLGTRHFVPYADAIDHLEDDAVTELAPEIWTGR